MISGSQCRHLNSACRGLIMGYPRSLSDSFTPFFATLPDFRGAAQNHRGEGIPKGLFSVLGLAQAVDWHLWIKAESKGQRMCEIGIRTAVGTRLQRHPSSW
jgi:hypothetical protein